MAGFTFGGPIILALVNPSALALYTACDQLQKTGSSAAAAVTNTFVNWVGKDAGPAGRRSRISLLVCAAGSLTFLSAWMFVGPHVVDVVFARQIAIDPFTNFLLGASIVAVFLLRSIELLQQIPLGRAPLVFSTAMWSSLAGVFLLALLGATWGTNGALAAGVAVGTAAMAFYGVSGRRSTLGVR